MQPLIPSSPAAAATGGETNRFYLWASCLVTALGGLMFGYDWVVISGADIFYEKYFNLTSASDTGWAKGCALAGCLVGSLVAGALSDRFGRKRLLICSALLFVVSSLATGLAQTFSAFVWWRIIGGTAAVRVSWQEAMAFCDWFGRTAGQRCALPTESQWEYACRAGTTTPLWFGDLTANFGPFANLADANLRGGLNTVRPWIPAIETVNDGATIPQNIAAYQPNPWGLYNMHGNAAEWTRSLCQPYPYRDDDGRNAISKRGSGQRSVRGGSFWDRPYRATSSARRSYEPWQRVFDVGFRIILEPDAATVAAAAK